MALLTANITQSANLSNTLQTHFNPQLISRIVESTKTEQFGQKAPLPEKAGKKSITFFRFAAANAANVTTMNAQSTSGASTTDPSEGGIDYNQLYYWTPNKMKGLSVSEVEATLAQYVEVIGVTDLSSLTSLFNLIDQAKINLSNDFALKFDDVIQVELAADQSSHNLGNTAKDEFCVSTGANTYVNYATNKTTMGMTNILDAVTALKLKHAPTYGGYYSLLTYPQICRDLQANSSWLDVHKYDATEEIFRGEVGRIYGARVVEQTNVFTIDHAGSQFTYSASDDDFVSFMFGQGSFGVPHLASQSPYSPSLQIAGGADKADPAGQLTTISYKSYFGAKALQPNWYARLYSTTGYA